jgi:hypothetical protein
MRIATLQRFALFAKPRVTMHDEYLHVTYIVCTESLECNSFRYIFFLVVFMHITYNRIEIITVTGQSYFSHLPKY